MTRHTLGKYDRCGRAASGLWPARGMEPLCIGQGACTVAPASHVQRAASPSFVTCIRPQTLPRSTLLRLTRALFIHMSEYLVAIYQEYLINVDVEGINYFLTGSKY